MDARNRRAQQRIAEHAAAEQHQTLLQRARRHASGRIGIRLHAATVFENLKTDHGAGAANGADRQRVITMRHDRQPRLDSITDRISARQ